MELLWLICIINRFHTCYQECHNVNIVSSVANLYIMIIVKIWLHECLNFRDTTGKDVPGGGPVGEVHNSGNYDTM